MATPAGDPDGDLNQRLRSMIIDNARKPVTGATGQSDGLAIDGGRGGGQRHVAQRGQSASQRNRVARNTQAKDAAPPAVRYMENTHRGNIRGNRGGMKPNPVQIHSRPEGYWRGQSSRLGHSSSQGSKTNEVPRGGASVRGGKFSDARARYGTSNPSAYAPLQRPQQSFAEVVDRQCTYLESLALQELPSLEMSAHEVTEKDNFRAFLQSHCSAAAQKYIHKSLQLQLKAFGSYASTFGMPGSDMDLALVISEVHPDLPRILERTLLDLGLGARLLTRTRVPILKLCERPTPELFAALREERDKWDAMTLEQREEHDKGTQEDAAGKKKDKRSSQQGNSGDPPADGDVLTENATPSSARLSDPQTSNADNKGPDRSRRRKSKRSSQSPNSEERTKNATADPSSTSPATSQDLGSTSSQAAVDGTDQRTEHDVSAKASVERPTIDRSNKHDEAPTSPEKLPVQETQNTDTTQAKDAQDPKPNRRAQKQWVRERALHPLDFPKSPPDIVGIQADINFSTTLGLHNTALLRAYSSSDPRVRPFILFVKRWASRRKINSSYNGTLSSYGYVLMSLHVLVNVAHPSVCPNLQMAATHKIPYGAPANSQRVYHPPAPDDAAAVADGYDVRFWRNEAELRSLSNRSLLTHNQQSVGALLRLFFLYYGSQGPRAPSGGFAWTQEVLSLRTPGGILTKQDKGWTGARTTAQREDGGGSQVRHRYLFAVEDPFEWEHNVGRTVTHFGIVAVRDEFRRMGRILESVGRTGAEGVDGGVLDAIIEAKQEQPDFADIAAQPEAGPKVTVDAAEAMTDKPTIAEARSGAD